MDLEGLRELKAKYPEYAVVAYINTTSELKTECDVCVTSSSAVQICSRLDNDKILLDVYKRQKQDRLATVLYNLMEGIRMAAVALAAYLPDTSAKILDRCV